MKSIGELYTFLNDRIPSSLSCDWDNDGLMVCGDRSAECKSVLLSLDVTKDTVKYAVNHGFSLIISHHPLIFKPLKGVNTLDFVSDKAVSLIKANVSVFSFHTRLDIMRGGVNDALSDRLGLINTEVFGEDDLGRIGDLAGEMTPLALAERVKEVLGSPKVALVEGKNKIKRVAVVGGDGKDYIKAACGAGADAYITGSMSYNSMLDAFDMGLTVIEAGHFETENPVLSALERLIKEFDNGIYTELYNSDPIKTI